MGKRPKNSSGKKKGSKSKASEVDSSSWRFCVVSIVTCLIFAHFAGASLDRCANDICSSFICPCGTCGALTSSCSMHATAELCHYQCSGTLKSQQQMQCEWVNCRSGVLAQMQCKREKPLIMTQQHMTVCISSPWTGLASGNYDE